MATHDLNTLSRTLIFPILVIQLIFIAAFSIIGFRFGGANMSMFHFSGLILRIFAVALVVLGVLSCNRSVDKPGSSDATSSTTASVASCSKTVQDLKNWADAVLDLPYHAKLVMPDPKIALPQVNEPPNLPEELPMVWALGELLMLDGSPEYVDTLCDGLRSRSRGKSVTFLFDRDLRWERVVDIVYRASSCGFTTQDFLFESTVPENVDEHKKLEPPKTWVSDYFLAIDEGLEVHPERPAKVLETIEHINERHPMTRIFQRCEALDFESSQMGPHEFRQMLVDVILGHVERCQCNVNSLEVQGLLWGMFGRYTRSAGTPVFALRVRVGGSEPDQSLVSLLPDTPWANASQHVRKAASAPNVRFILRMH